MSIKKFANCELIFKKLLDKFSKCEYNQTIRLQNANWQGGDDMFRNLEAEQARFGYTNLETAKILGISRNSYEKKKKTGKFTATEVKLLCKTFNTTFEYLFADSIE